MEQQKSQKKPVIAISIGDINGIGPEVIMKTFQDARMLEYCTPVVFATHSVISYHKKALANLRFNYYTPKSPDQVRPDKINLISCWDERVNITLGQPDKETGKFSFLSLQKAVEAVKENHADGIVTAPINKYLLQDKDFNFPGHTEYLGAQFEGSTPMMLFLSPHLKVACATGHIRLGDVSDAITSELLTERFKTLHNSLDQDFLINKPRIGVLGLNPHAGESGLLGNKEKEVIEPVMESLRNKGYFLRGPFPADGYFGTGMFRKFDATLAMYHDQGLIPFKTIAFEEGVNFTAGLPVVRTSPDHGTGYALAGENKADETSFRNAVLEACKIINNRTRSGKAAENPLKARANIEKEN